MLFTLFDFLYSLTRHCGGQQMSRRPRQQVLPCNAIPGFHLLAKIPFINIELTTYDRRSNVPPKVEFAATVASATRELFSTGSVLPSRGVSSAVQGR